MKFKAAILVEQNKPLVLDELSVPMLHAGQVLVKIMRSSICGAQLGEISGVKGPDKYLPHLLGHEGGGIVLDMGPGCRHVHIGDHVVLHWRKGVGIDASPARFRYANHNICDGWIGAGPVTTFSELAIVSENRLTPIDQDIPFEIASLMGCAVTTALGLINNDAKLKLGQSIAVIGCGGVGLNIIQGAALVGGFPIVGVDISTAAQWKALDFGATHVASSLNEISKTSIDVIVETTGRPELIEQAYKLTAPSGKTVLVGQMHWNSHASIQTLPMHAGKMLFASEGGQTDPSVDIPRYLDLYKNKRLHLDTLIGATGKLEQINEMLDSIRTGQVSGRCMIEMDWER